MDANTKFLIKRMDDLRQEIKEDITGVLNADKEEREKLEKRVRSLESLQNKAIGAAFIGSGLVSWFYRKIGG